MKMFYQQQTDTADITGAVGQINQKTGIGDTTGNGNKAIKQKTVKRDIRQIQARA